MSQAPQFNRKKVGSKIPTSLDLRDCATKGFVDTNTLRMVPSELLPLAVSILESTRKLEQLMAIYNKKRATVCQSSVEHLRKEWDENIQKNREDRCAKESTVQRKRAIKSLDPTSKRFLKTTGKTPEEFQKEMLKAFKLFLETQNKS